VAFNIHNMINRESELWKTLWRWPKIELHRHLEGAIRLSTLLEAAAEFDIPLPAYDLDHLRPHVQIVEDDEPTFSVFLSKFNVLRQFYRSMELIRRITREAVEDAASDHISYFEMRFTPHALARQNNYTYQSVIEAVCEETARAAADFNIPTRLIVSVNRHESVQIAEQGLDAALEVNDPQIIGMDLAGQEAGHSARPFRSLFYRAREAGLHITVHAGEWAGPENVADAIEHSLAERIGHGVRSVEDSLVVQMVRDRGVTLEVCPTSNLHSGVVRRVEHHPLPDLIYLGVPTTINTDDPSLSNITLTDELMLAHVGMGLPFHMIKDCILNAARAAFLPDADRAQLVADIEAGLANAPVP